MVSVLRLFSVTSFLGSPILLKISEDSNLKHRLQQCKTTWGLVVSALLRYACTWILLDLEMASADADVQGQRVAILSENCLSLYN